MSSSSDGIFQLSANARVMPKTNKSWNEEQQNLGAAKALAAFLNVEFQPLVAVENVETFEAFQERHQNFMLWWFLWRQLQKQLREVWDNGFRQPHVLRVLAADRMGGDPYSFIPFGRKPNPQLITTFKDTKTGEITEEVTSVAEHEGKVLYRKAVLFLFTASWRAKTCGYCGRSFIAESSRAKFCTYGDTEAVDGTIGSCFQAHRKKYKPENWKKNRKKTNERRREEYRLKRRIDGGRDAARKNLRKK
jgi:hypothetical protein